MFRYFDLDYGMYGMLWSSIGYFVRQGNVITIDLDIGMYEMIEQRHYDNQFKLTAFLCPHDKYKLVQFKELW